MNWKRSHLLTAFLSMMLLKASCIGTSLPKTPKLDPGKPGYAERDPFLDDSEEVLRTLRKYKEELPSFRDRLDENAYRELEVAMERNMKRFEEMMELYKTRPGLAEIKMISLKNFGIGDWEHMIQAYLILHPKWGNDINAMVEQELEKWGSWINDFLDSDYTDDDDGYFFLRRNRALGMGTGGSYSDNDNRLVIFPDVKEHPLHHEVAHFLADDRGKKGLIYQEGYSGPSWPEIVEQMKKRIEFPETKEVERRLKTISEGIRLDVFLSPEEQFARAVESLMRCYVGEYTQNIFTLTQKEVDMFSRMTYKGENIFGYAVEKYSIALGLRKLGYPPNNIQNGLEYATEFSHPALGNSRFSWHTNGFKIKGEIPLFSPK